MEYSVNSRDLGKHGQWFLDRGLARFSLFKRRHVRHLNQLSEKGLFEYLIANPIKHKPLTDEEELGRHYEFYCPELLRIKDFLLKDQLKNSEAIALLDTYVKKDMKERADNR